MRHTLHQIDRLYRGSASERWYCMDCARVVELDRHGRCERCNSDALAHPEHTQPLQRGRGAR